MGYNSEGMTDNEENINWDEVGKPVSKGEYDFELVKAEYKPTSTQKHMVVCHFKIVSAYDADNEDNVERLVFENFVFTQAAAFRVKQFAKATGVELPSTINKTYLEEWCSMVLGTNVGGVVGHNLFQGEPRATIAKFFEFGSGGDAEEKPSADAKPTTPKPNGKSTPAPVEDEDEDDDNDDDDDEVEDVKPKVSSITEAMSKTKTKKSATR